MFFQLDWELYIDMKEINRREKNPQSLIMYTWLNDEGRQVLYFVDKEKLICEKFTEEGKQPWELQLVRNSKWNLCWGSRLVESNKFCLYSFLSFNIPISGDKDVYLLFSTRRVLFLEKIYFLQSGG